MNDQQWSALAEVIQEEPGLASADAKNLTWPQEEKFKTMPQRYANRDQLNGLIADWTSKKEAQGLMQKLQAKGVPAGAVQDARDVTRVDPQLAHRDHWVRLPHAEMGESIYNALPFRFSQTPVRPTRPAPLLGEHTREILRDMLGLSEQEIDELQAQEVLK